MRRVLIIHQHDPAINHVGGVGTYINTFVKYAPADFEVSLIGVSTDAATHPIGKWQKLKVEGTNRLLNYLPIVESHPTYHGPFPLSIRFAWALWKYRSRIDFKNAILELHRIEPELALLGVKELKVCFFHTHTQDLYNPKTEIFWKKAPWLYFLLERPLLKNMNQLYSVREDLIDWYKKRYPELKQPFLFCPTWVDEDAFRSLPEPERLKIRQELAKTYGPDSSKKWLLYVGRFELQKDPDLLLNSFRHLHQQRPETQLILVGGGSMEPMIRNFIKEQNLEKSIFIIPPQKQPEIARWMNASDCFVLTSAYEGMPRVVLECLQCGLPAVSHDEGEARRVLGSGAGRLVTDRTPEAFSKAFADVLDRPVNRELCQKGVLPYSAAKILENLFESYRKLQGPV